MIRVGQKLYEERTRKKLTIDDVSSATKIRPSFLSAIEKGEYQKLPSSAYVQGFVANYAQFLGLPKREMLALFRREFDVERSVKVLPEGMVPNQNFPRRLIVRGKIFVVIMICIIIASYFTFQYRYAFINPPLTVESPREKSVTDRNVVVAGYTDPNATVTVNEDAVALYNNGKFLKKITVFPGNVIIIIKAKNRFGRETVVQRTITVRQ